MDLAFGSESSLYQSKISPSFQRENLRSIDLCLFGALLRNELRIGIVKKVIYGARMEQGGGGSKDYLS